MNWAALESLPVVFVLENNQLAYSTPTAHQFAVDPAARAAGYGIESVSVDGNDVEAVFDAVCEARARALAGSGPTLIEAQTMRMHGHGAHDDARYVDPELLEEWARRDPIDRYSAVAAEHGIDVEALRGQVAASVAAASAAALETPMPDPARALEDVFCVGEPQGLGAGAAPWSGFAPESPAC